jgi:adenosylmethionine---8-amino-7-oxononanoate aminotransferase
MKHHERWPLVPIAAARGVWLYGPDGRRYLDAVSSWWTNLFGHADPAINTALKAQLDTLPHAMLAGLTHEPAVRLAERLAKLTGLGHAFFASDGASAVEIALKMSFHYWRNVGRPQKRYFVSLAGGYHGETLGALSVTDVAIFRDAYGLLTRNNLQVPCPRPLNGATPCCAECVQSAVTALQQLFAQRADEIAALIIEPLVQGANGMQMYHASYLKHARALCDEYDVHLIADEIMTGFGRTGAFLAVDHADIRADFITLSKGITGGYLPLSCVLTTDVVYAAFYDDDLARGFLHSHSYTGNTLACAAANAVLDRFEQDRVIARNAERQANFARMEAPLKQHASVLRSRHLGMIWAYDIHGQGADFARRLFAAGCEREVLLRPIGNTVYLMPPYVITDDEFTMLVGRTIAAIEAVLNV